MENTLQ
nr:unnamed protein product [Callosobruchus analis]